MHMNIYYSCANIDFDIILFDVSTILSEILAKQSNKNQFTAHEFCSTNYKYAGQSFGGAFVNNIVINHVIDTNSKDAYMVLAMAPIPTSHLFPFTHNILKKEEKYC